MSASDAIRAALARIGEGGDASIARGIEGIIGAVPPSVLFAASPESSALRTMILQSVGSHWVRRVLSATSPLDCSLVRSAFLLLTIAVNDDALIAEAETIICELSARLTVLAVSSAACAEAAAVACGALLDKRRDLGRAVLASLLQFYARAADTLQTSVEPRYHQRATYCLQCLVNCLRSCNSWISCPTSSSLATALRYRDVGVLEALAAAGGGLASMYIRRQGNDVSSVAVALYEWVTAAAAASTGRQVPLPVWAISLRSQLMADVSRSTDWAEPSGGTTATPAEPGVAAAEELRYHALRLVTAFVKLCGIQWLVTADDVSSSRRETAKQEPPQSKPQPQPATQASFSSSGRYAKLLARVIGTEIKLLVDEVEELVVLPESSGAVEAGLVGSARGGVAAATPAAAASSAASSVEAAPAAAPTAPRDGDDDLMMSVGDALKYVEGPPGTGAATKSSGGGVSTDAAAAPADGAAAAPATPSAGDGLPPADNPFRREVLRPVHAMTRRQRFARLEQRYQALIQSLCAAVDAYIALVSAVSSLWSSAGDGTGTAQVALPSLDSDVLLSLHETLGQTCLVLLMFLADAWHSDLQTSLMAGAAVNATSASSNAAGNGTATSAHDTVTVPVRAAAVLPLAALATAGCASYLYEDGNAFQDESIDAIYMMISSVGSGAPSSIGVPSVTGLAQLAAAALDAVDTAAATSGSASPTSTSSAVAAEASLIAFASQTALQVQASLSKVPTSPLLSVSPAACGGAGLHPLPSALRMIGSRLDRSELILAVCTAGVVPMALSYLRGQARSVALSLMSADAASARGGVVARASLMGVINVRSLGQVIDVAATAIDLSTTTAGDKAIAALGYATLASCYKDMLVTAQRLSSKRMRDLCSSLALVPDGDDGSAVLTAAAQHLLALAAVCARPILEGAALPAPVPTGTSSSTAKAPSFSKSEALEALRHAAFEFYQGVSLGGSGSDFGSMAIDIGGPTGTGKATSSEVTDDHNEAGNTARRLLDIILDVIGA